MVEQILRATRIDVQVHDGSALEEAIDVAIGDATGHGNHQFRPGLLELTKLAKFTPETVLRTLTDGATRQQDQVGISRGRYWRMTVFVQRAGDPFAVGDIHLTADRPEVVFHQLVSSRRLREVSMNDGGPSEAYANLASWGGDGARVRASPVNQSCTI